MKKLEDIPKSRIFEVPDGYFDSLPMQIQARVEKQTPRVAVVPFWVVSLKYALPVLVLGLGIFYFMNRAGKNAEEMLTSVSTETLIAYLEEEGGMSADELIELLDFDGDDIEDIEMNSYEQIEMSEEELLELEEEFEVEIK